MPSLRRRRGRELEHAAAVPEPGHPLQDLFLPSRLLPHNGAVGIHLKMAEVQNVSQTTSFKDGREKVHDDYLGGLPMRKKKYKECTIFTFNPDYIFFFDPVVLESIFYRTRAEKSWTEYDCPPSP